MRVSVLFIVALLLVATLASGCGGRPEKYGNLADARSVELVEDAAGILKTTYPPAKTRLNLLHLYADDAFGAALLETLRREGYAIAEYAPPLRGGKYAETPVRPDGLDFAYVVDRLNGDGGTRLTLFVGSDTLSRLYSVGGGPEEPTYAPMGDWARKQ